MNCFRHRNATAVGVCRACGKGLCGDCLVEVPYGLACRDSCEERAAALHALIASGPPANEAFNAGLRRQAAFFCLLSGLSFVAAYWCQADGQTNPGRFLALSGATFLLIGLWTLFARKIPR
jgi:hypothetical protein